MQQTLRPYVTAGIAIVGSGLIAATPAVTPSASVPTIRDVALTAGGGLPDLVAPWTEVFNEASQNASQLLNNYYIAPGIAFQQMLANQTEFWQSALDDPSTIPAVMQQMQSNLDAVLTGFSLFNASGGGDINGFTGTVGQVIMHTLSGTDVASPTPAFGHDLLFALLPQFLPADQAEFMTPIINFLASPLSGIIMGSIGPSIAPWIAMMNSIQDGDGLTEIMASWMGGFLNGATLDLDFLIPIIEDSGLLPMPEGTITHLDFTFGGLLTGGDVASGPYEVSDGTDIVASVPAVGGSIFNSLGIGLDASAIGLPLQITIDSHGIGPIAAWEAWGQTVGSLLGSGWDGKDPVVVTPPGAGIGFPIIPDSWFDDSGVAPDVDPGESAADLLGGMGLDDLIAALSSL
ncbi:MAG: outer membrane porin GjpA [Actinomycetota bacterium]|nr:outer membrane porin GjpA [Actinomycetota bacterium]